MTPEEITDIEKIVSKTIHMAETQKIIDGFNERVKRDKIISEFTTSWEFMTMLFLVTISSFGLGILVGLTIHPLW